MEHSSKPSARASAFLIDNLLKESSTEQKYVSLSPTSTHIHPAFRDSKQTTVVTLQSACVERELQTDSDNSSCCSSPEPTSSFSEKAIDTSSDRTISRKKKNRTSFTNHQLQQLELTYRQQRYLPADERTLLARRLKLSEQQVKTWFQNRRMKEKRQVHNNDVTYGVTMTPNTPVHALPHLGFTPGLLSPPAVPFSGLVLPTAVQSSGFTSPMPFKNFTLAQPLTVSVSSIPESGYNHINRIPSGFSRHYSSNNGLLMAKV